MESEHDSWSAGSSYERYMGRWSRQIAELFVDWLGAPKGADWLELGCGTGALSRAILERAAPKSLFATDQSEDFARFAAGAVCDDRVQFGVAAADDLPAEDASVDVVASALMLNFVPDRIAALQEMQRTLRPGGLLSFYVWDYPGGGMGFIDAFWRAAKACDPGAAALDESARFPFCTEAGLRAICVEAGLADVEAKALEVTTEFADFEAFWQPFTLGAGPAPGYCQSLGAPARAALKARLAADLGPTRPIALPARAWAFRARLGTG